MLHQATALFVIVVASVAAVAHARTFRCEQVYKNASSSNQFATCFTDTSHLQTVALDSDHLPYTILAAIPLVIFIVGLLCWPAVTCARYCCNCCGSYRRRPGTLCCGGEEWDLKSDEEKEAAYRSSSIRNAKIATFIVFLIGVGSVVPGVMGTSSFNASYSKIFLETKTVLTWVDTQSASIRRLLTIPATGALIPPLTDEMFDKLKNITGDFRVTIDDGKKSLDGYVGQVYAAAIFLCSVPLVFLFLTIISACFNVRTGLLCCNSFIHYLFFIIFSLCAAGILLASMIVTDVCGERDLFLANPNAKGLISLAGVPLCEANIPFERIKTDVNSVIVSQAAEACTYMTNICSTTAAYSTTTPDKVFHCQNLNAPSVDCPTFAAAKAQGDSLVLKTAASTVVACVNNGVTLTPCTLTQCASYCTDTNIRSIASTAVTALNYASNGTEAYASFVEPLLSCALVYRQALLPLVSCTNMADSLYMMGGSLFGFTVAFVSGMVVIWRGQKRFFFKMPKSVTEPFTDIVPS